jgi:Lysylphosphatidylglycerol synthase TM region
MSAVAGFFAQFGHAFSHLVVWAYLLAVAPFLGQTVARSRAWRNLLAATFPSAEVRWRDAYGATLVKHGAGTFLPMHGDEAVRVALMKDRIDGASSAAIAATAGVDTAFDVLLTAVLVGVSAWLGASVVDWHELAAHPLKPTLLLGLVLAAIAAAVVALRRKAKGLGEELRQGVVIFKHRGAYTRNVLGWQLADFALQLATLYLLLLAFGFGGATPVSVVLIRTAQRVTVSLPGFLETGSQQAMIMAILTQSGFTAGQAFGFGFGAKVTLSGLNVVLALIASRIMVGPLHLGARIRGTLRRSKSAAQNEGDFPKTVQLGTDAAAIERARSSVR